MSRSPHAPCTGTEIDIAVGKRVCLYVNMHVNLCTAARAVCLILAVLQRTPPRLRSGYPPNLSISVSGGKETNRDSLSKGD